MTESDHVEQVNREARNSTILESSGEDSILFETVKNMVKQQNRKGMENEEDFFLVSQDQEKQYFGASTKEATLHQTEETLQWTDLCRICANANNHLIPIFEGEGAELDLPSKILMYLPIHVSKSDTLPLQLCYHCAVTLLAWHELNKDCLNAEKKLLEIQDVLQNKQQNYSALPLINLNDSTAVSTTISTISNIAISQTDQQTDDKGNIHVPEETNDIEETNKLSRSCGVQTPFRVFLDTQNIFWKPYRKRPAEAARVKKPSAAKDCDSVWVAVMDTSLDQPTELPAEPPRSNDPLRLPVDTGEEAAPAADETAKRKRKRRNASKSHKQCGECGKCFKLKDSYLRHMRIHKDERPFTCHICGKQFRDSGGLSRHLKDVHAKLKNFTCDLCGRSFASKATREDHRRTHTGERPYVCDSCGKTFKSKASLYIHSKLHTDEFPHSCTYCAKRFRRRQEMLAHVTTHTGEKNHTCDTCSKKFRIKSELARHQLIHSEHKPFACVKCGLAFRQKRYLNNHVKSRHNESLRACGPARERSFAAYCSSRNAARWVNNLMTKYEIRATDAPERLTPTTEDVGAISERETRDSSSNSSDVELDEKEDSSCGRYSKLTKGGYTCDNCRRVFRTKYHLTRHMANCESRGSAERTKSPTTRVRAARKSKSVENGSMKRENSSHPEDRTGDAEDDEDQRQTESAKSSRKRSSRTYPCRHCEYTAEKKKLLNVHLTEMHSEFARKNRKSFVDTETVARARMEHDGKVYYHCSDCGKNLNSPYTFYWHIRIHTGERLFTCHMCGKRFRVNQGLARHLKETHAGIKNIPCDLCGRMFSTRRNAEDHRRIHTGERPYVCNVCGKTFKQKASLFVHNRTHSDVFPFKCSYCEQTFRTRPPLMVHITKHTGEKPYACDVCGRCFRIKYELKRHRLIHSDEKPWHCTDCDLSFRQKRYLINHKRLNHEVAQSRRSTAAK